MTHHRNLWMAIIFFSISGKCLSQKVIVHAFMESKKSTAGNDTIYYDFNRNLTWNDFKGKPVESYFAGAVTASGFAFDSEMNSDGKNIYLNIGVYTFFSKNDSWKKPGVNSEYHLLHEQHHFDITRLSAEKFYSELLKANFTINNYQKLLSSLFNKAFDENSVLQNQYDSETRHSINTSEQLKWNDKIEQEVKSL